MVTSCISRMQSVSHRFDAQRREPKNDIDFHFQRVYARRAFSIGARP